MSLERYYEKYYLQELVEKPSNLQPPFETIKKFSDGCEVIGFFNQTQSSERPIASANPVRTQGRFATHPSSSLSPGNVLRRASDGAYIRLTSDSLIAPSFAVSLVKTYEAHIVSSDETEQFAQSGEKNESSI